MTHATPDLATARAALLDTVSAHVLDQARDWLRTEYRACESVHHWTRDQEDWRPVREVKPGEVYVSLIGTPIRAVKVNAKGELTGAHVFTDHEDHQYSWHSVSVVPAEFIERITPHLGVWRAYVIAESEQAFVDRMMSVFRWPRSA